MKPHDNRLEPEWPLREETGRPPQRETDVIRSRKPGVNPALIALGGLILVLLFLWLFTATRNPDQDKLNGAASANTAATVDPEKSCSSKATYDLIRRELFRHAAQVRGSDQGTFENLSNYAVLRMENPVMESQDDANGAVNCSGSAALDLPPGVAVVGGRRSLGGDIDYTVQPAADGTGNVVLLRNADAIITPLATLARVAPAPQAPPSQTPADGTAVIDPLATQPATPAPAPASPPQAAPQPAPKPVNARPSFDCGDARTRGEIAVCSEAGLATLDRQMAAQFNRSMGIADPQQRAALIRTRDRFLSYRDRCGNNACISDAYRGRMREISDIMSGRWRP
jgi:hypothetical protein